MDLEAGRLATVRIPKKTEDEFERGSSSRYITRSRRFSATRESAGPNLAEGRS